MWPSWYENYYSSSFCSCMDIDFESIQYYLFEWRELTSKVIRCYIDKGDLRSSHPP